MRVRIQDKMVSVYPAPNAGTMPITSLSAGQEVEIGGSRKSNQGTFVAVKLPDGRKGFLPGSAKIIRIKSVTLLAPDAKLYAEPSASASVVSQFRKGEKFFVAEVVKKDD